MVEIIIRTHWDLFVGNEFFKEEFSNENIGYVGDFSKCCEFDDEFIKFNENIIVEEYDLNNEYLGLMFIIDANYAYLYFPNKNEISFKELVDLKYIREGDMVMTINEYIIKDILE